jgi:hypothetical protein
MLQTFAAGARPILDGEVCRFHRLIPSLLYRAVFM